MKGTASVAAIRAELGVDMLSSSVAFLNRNSTVHRRSIALMIAGDASGYLASAYLQMHGLTLPCRSVEDGGVCRSVLDADFGATTVAGDQELPDLLRWILDHRCETEGFDENAAAARARADRLCRFIHQLVVLLAQRGLYLPRVPRLADRLLALVLNQWPLTLAQGLPVRSLQGVFYVPDAALQRLICKKPWGMRLNGMFTGQACLPEGMYPWDVERALEVCLKERP